MHLGVNAELKLRMNKTEEQKINKKALIVLCSECHNARKEVYS